MLGSYLDQKSGYCYRGSTKRRYVGVSIGDKVTRKCQLLKLAWRTYQETRTANVHSVNPVVSTVIELDVSTDVPKANVTPIVL